MNSRFRWLIPTLVILLPGIGLLPSHANAAGGGRTSHEGVWERLDRAPSSQLDREPRMSLRAYELFRLDRWRLTAILERAPRDLPQDARSADVELSLPMPDGSFARFRIAESPVMAPELASKFPQIRTYTGQGMDDPSLTVRFDWTPHGFHAQVLSPRGRVYVGPYWEDDGDFYASYHGRDQIEDVDAEPFQCYAQLDMEQQIQLGSGFSDPGADAEFAISPLQSGETLITYRLAVAATAEYTALHSLPDRANVADGLSAVVTTINHVTGIFETELAVRLELVPNNHLIIYTNPETDPYTDSDIDRMIVENAQTLGRVIGEENYDIGHVFGTRGGGVAWFGVVCSGSGKKDRGASGLSRPVGSLFDITLAAHEIGHQFNAFHTWNSPFCDASQWSPQTAMEPGSGSTIMSYAGFCSTDSIQPQRDPFYHSVSYDQIRKFVTIGSGKSCGALSATRNLAPVVDAGPDYTIPRRTPFVLTASGSDPDGGPLTYSWEERDIGPRHSLHESDNGKSPLFRVYSPTSNPSRFFPRLEFLLGNRRIGGDLLPEVPRIMDFRVTVRDNHPLGAGIGWDEMQVTVTDASGPFRVTSPNTPVTWWEEQVVRWNVSGSDLPPVAARSVNILLSADGGWTYPFVLAANTPNDGIEVVTMPNIYTPAARIRVEAVDNVFFDVSNKDFTVLRKGGRGRRQND